jgi:hypothetical protein
MLFRSALKISRKRTCGTSEPALLCRATPSPMRYITALLRRFARPLQCQRFVLSNAVAILHICDDDLDLGRAAVDEEFDAVDET